jgi:hypothetical protein
LYTGIRISNTISEVEHATLGDSEISDYLYSDVISVLSTTTSESLRHPRLASAKISYQDINGNPNRLMFYIAWVESLPSIDGICFHLPSELFVIELHNIPHENNYGWILYVLPQLVLETDPQWEKWLKIIDLLKTQSIYVSLVRNKKILKEKIELKFVPFPTQLRFLSVEQKE